LLTTLERNPYPLAFLRGHMRDDLNAVAFSLDGQTLASGSRDNMIILWDTFDAATLATLREE